MQAGQSVGKIRLQPARRIQRRHEREHADAEQHRRCERAEKPQSRHQADDEIRGDDGPRDERRGFVEIIDRTLVDGETALEHGDRVQREPNEQQKITRAVVRAKTLSPEENQINRAQAVKRYGEQKKMPVSEPKHEIRLIQESGSAKAN